MKKQAATYEMIMINKYGIETIVAVSCNPVFMRNDIGVHTAR